MSNKALVRSYFERAMNQGGVDWLDQIIAPSFGTPGSGPHQSGAAGPTPARAMVEHYRRAFPDMEFTVEDLLAEGGRVVIRVSFRGTHGGEVMGLPATGRQVTASGVELAILANGQIAAAGWQYHDQLGLLRQSGAWPTHGSSLDAGYRHDHP